MTSTVITQRAFARTRTVSTLLGVSAAAFAAQWKIPLPLLRCPSPARPSLSAPLALPSGGAGSHRTSGMVSCSPHVYVVMSIRIHSGREDETQFIHGSSGRFLPLPSSRYSRQGNRGG
jgi:hypothetical protein